MVSQQLLPATAMRPLAARKGYIFVEHLNMILKLLTKAYKRCLTSIMLLHLCDCCLFKAMCTRYGVSVDNTVEENSSVFSLIQMRWLPSARHAGSKTLHQQNPAVIN